MLLMFSLRGSLVLPQLTMFCPLLSIILLISLSSAVLLPEENALIAVEKDISNLEISNVVGVIDVLIKGGGTVQNVLQKFNEIINSEDVKKLVKEAEDNVLKIIQGISHLNEQYKKYTGEALEEITSVKIKLKESRRSLNSLASSTKNAVQDLKTLSKAVFDNNEDKEEEFVNAIDLGSSEKMEYVQEQITVMKDLIEDTKKKIEEVKKNYSDVRARMAKLEKNLIEFKFTVIKDLEKEISGTKSTSNKARAGVYLPATIVTTFCYTLSGALWGTCSAVNAAVAGTGAIIMEMTLGDMRAKLEILRNDGEIAIKSVQELLENQKNMETYLDKEEQVLEFWVDALVTVERKIKNPDRLFFRKLPAIRENYLASLDSLGRVAQDYLDLGDLGSGGLKIIVEEASVGFLDGSFGGCREKDPEPRQTVLPNVACAEGEISGLVSLDSLGRVAQDHLDQEQL